MSKNTFDPNYPQKSHDFGIVAVDIVIFSLVKGELSVLLIQMKKPPFTGKWALPGGLVKLDESVDEAAIRHLKTKAGVKDVFLGQLYTFGEVDRDPYGRVVSVAYFALVPEHKIKPETTQEYGGIGWFSLADMPSLAYDHKRILMTALDRLRSKIAYTNIVYSLLPKEFTLSDLQAVYETILDKELDRRNFRKKILSLDLLNELPKKTTGQASRPAQLYSFKETSPKNVEIL